MIGVDKPAQLLYPPPPQPPPPFPPSRATTRKSLRCASSERQQLPPVAGVDACFPPVFTSFYFIILTCDAGLPPWSQPDLPARRGAPLWPNNEVGRAAQIPSSSLRFSRASFRPLVSQRRLFCSLFGSCNVPAVSSSFQHTGVGLLLP